jgi:hypothetical protein
MYAQIIPENSAEEERRTMIEINEQGIRPYFGFGGGFIGTFVAWNTSPVNSISRDYFQADVPYPSFLYMSGAHGILSTGIIDNLRIGIDGRFGSARRTHILSPTQERAISTDISMTSLTLDYMFIPLKGLAIAVGTGIGFGSQIVEFSSYTPSAFSFPGIVAGATTSFRMQTSDILLQPMVNCEYLLTSFSMLRLGVGYTAPLLGSWTASGSGLPITDMPAMTSGQGLSIQFGVFIGLFNY